MVNNMFKPTPGIWGSMFSDDEPEQTDKIEQEE